MESFGLLKFLKSPYPAARQTPAAPPPEQAYETPVKNGGKSPENAVKNGKNEVKNAEKHTENGEIYLDFMEKQRNLSRKIDKK